MVEHIRYSDDYQQVLLAAKEAAAQRDQNVVETLHLLFAIVDVDENFGRMILKDLLKKGGRDLIDLRGIIDKALKWGHTVGSIEPDFSDEAEYVLNFAASKAATNGYTEVGCDHLLFSIMHEKKEATRILSSLGIGIKSVHMRMRELIAF